MDHLKFRTCKNADTSSCTNENRVICRYIYSEVSVPQLQDNAVRVQTLVIVTISVCLIMSTAAEILQSLPKDSLDSQVSDEHIAELARQMKTWELYMPDLLREDADATRSCFTFSASSACLTLQNTIMSRR